MAMIENYKNQREFARIRTSLAMKVRLVSPDEKTVIENRMGETQGLFLKPPPSLSDPALQEWFQFIDAKLNLILQIIFESHKEIQMPSQSCSLSGAGISFVSSEKYSVGDTLELKIVYPSYPPQIIDLYGEIMRIEETDGKYSTALQFTMINDLIRDKIVQLVFEKEREMIRQQKESN